MTHAQSKTTPPPPAWWTRTLSLRSHRMHSCRKLSSIWPNQKPPTLRTCENAIAGMEREHSLLMQHLLLYPTTRISISCTGAWHGGILLSLARGQANRYWEGDAAGSEALSDLTKKRSPWEPAKAQIAGTKGKHSLLIQQRLLYPNPRISTSCSGARHGGILTSLAKGQADRYWRGSWK